MATRDFRSGHAAQPGDGMHDRGNARPYGELLTLQRSSGNRAVTDLLRRDAGRPLDAATRADMEAKFGRDFGDVRLHTGVEASVTAQAQNAKAYTFGTDIVFKGGDLNPVTSGGKRLLAHELAHVVQQSRKSGPRSKQAETPSLESSAEQAALQSENSAQVQVAGTASPGIARSSEDAELLQRLAVPGVEMPWVGKGPGIDSSELGFLRDPDKFWKAYAEQHGGTPEELRLLRETSDHHHIGKGGKAVPVPRAVHQQSSKALHPSESPVELTGEVTAASELAGVPTNELHPVDPATQEWKGSGQKAGPTPEAIAGRQRTDAMKPNSRRKPPAASEIEDFEIREEAVDQGPSTRADDAVAKASKEKTNARRRASRASKKAAAAKLSKPESSSQVETPPGEGTTPTLEGPTTESIDPVIGATPVEAESAHAPVNAAEAVPPVAVESLEAEEAAEAAGKVARLGGKLGKVAKFGGAGLGAGLAVFGTYEEAKAEMKQGESKGEAVSGALGSTAGSFTASPSAVVANIVNMGIQTIGSRMVAKAEKEHANEPSKAKKIKDRVAVVTGAAQTLIEVLPSSTITQGVKAAGRSAWNLAHGDLKAMDKQAEGWEHGEGGAPLMGLTMATDLIASVAGGEDSGHALNRVTKMGEGTAVAKAGDYLGDQAFQFINKDLPEAEEFAKKDLKDLRDNARQKLSQAWSWVSD